MDDDLAFRVATHLRMDFQCQQLARYDMDGKKLCSRHVGEVALAFCLQHPDLIDP